MQRHRCYTNIPMNVFVIMNIVIVQRRRCYTNIPMNVFAIANVIAMQHHRCYINVPMNVSPILNVITTQLGTSCVFDSPGLARNEPTPGQRLQGDSTP